MSLLKGSFFLKALALVTAVVAYLYIHNDVNRPKETPTISDQSFRLLKPVAKNIPVKVRLATEPPEGYVILEDQVKTNPSSMVVIAPEALLDEGSHAETALLDVSENTRTLVKRIPLESVAGTHLAGEPYFVEVTVPIQKLESAEPAQQ